MKRIPANNCLALIFVFLVTNLVTPKMLRQAVAQDASAIPRPPVARVRPVVDDHFGR